MSIRQPYNAAQYLVQFRLFCRWSLLMGFHFPHVQCIDIFMAFLGRLPKVDLIILEGEKCPSVRTSVRPQKVSSI